MPRKPSSPKRVRVTRTRREFLRDLGATALVASGFTALGLSSYSEDPVRERIIQADPLKDFLTPLSDQLPQMSVVRGSTVEPMVREALQLLGGMERFITKGDRVLIKPNIGWDRQPEQAANTDPLLIAELGANLPNNAIGSTADVIFSDGFESGDTSVWSAVVP